MSGLTNGEVSVFGGGLYADVTGNTQVTINTGNTIIYMVAGMWKALIIQPISEVM